MSETMIERVADAICLAANKFRKENGPAADYAKRAYQAEARAAIEAMREPSEAMLLAFHESRFDDAPSNHDATISYQAMIDAALKEAK